MKTTIEHISRLSAGPLSAKLAILVCAICLALSACNTIKGVGKDTEEAGEVIQKEADRHIDPNKKDVSSIQSRSLQISLKDTDS